MSAPGRPLSRRAFVSGACAAGCFAVAGCADGGDQAPEPPGPVQVPVADVPVGGGVILAKNRVVVTQPEAGTFRAFSAVCTHQNCLVSAISNGEILCRCHGSAFSVADGSVLRNPATQPLPARPVTQNDGSLTIGA